MAALEIHQSIFDENVKKGIVGVSFFSEGCMDCLMFSPVIEELSEKYGDKIKFVKVNLNENRPLLKRFNIIKTPTVIILLEGVIVKRIVNPLYYEDVECEIQEFLD